MFVRNNNLAAVWLVIHKYKCANYISEACLDGRFLLCVFIQFTLCKHCQIWCDYCETHMLILIPTLSEIKPDYKYNVGRGLNRLDNNDSANRICFAQITRDG